MKKQMKVLTAILMIIMLLNALLPIATMAWDPTSTIETMDEESTIDTSRADEVGRAVITIVRVIGVVVAIVMLLVLGIKYMAGSAEQRAEYKKTMVPYVVGAVLLFASTTIVGVIYDFVKNVNGEG